MANHLSQDEVRGIAEYARIGLTDAELAQMTQDLNGTLDSLDTIFEYDLDGVEPTFHPIGSLSNVMRKDVEQQSFSQATALENAPASQDGCFLIPSILGCEGDEE